MTLETGSETLDGNGYFVEPAIFIVIESDIAIARVDIFGPILSVLTLRDESEAIEIAMIPTTG